MYVYIYIYIYMYIYISLSLYIYIDRRDARGSASEKKPAVSPMETGRKSRFCAQLRTYCNYMYV